MITKYTINLPAITIPSDWRSSRWWSSLIHALLQTCNNERDSSFRAHFDQRVSLTRMSRLGSSSKHSKQKNQSSQNVKIHHGEGVKIDGVRWEFPLVHFLNVELQSQVRFSRATVCERWFSLMITVCTVYRWPFATSLLSFLFVGWTRHCLMWLPGVRMRGRARLASWHKCKGAKCTIDTWLTQTRQEHRDLELWDKNPAGKFASGFQRVDLIYKLDRFWIRVLNLLIRSMLDVNPSCY